MPLPLPGANQAPAAAESGHLRLLALIASPLSNAAGDGPPQGQQLDVWGEWERLRQSIAAAHDPVNRRAAPWEVIRQAPSTAAGLQTALIAAPDVLHVCAHAGPEGLLIEDDLGREAELPRARLAQIVRGRGLKLAVLNACATAKIAKALLDAGVPAVVGSSDKIFDGEGMVFARHFHGALATGASVGEALAAAQAAIIAAYESRELPWRVGASDASEQRAAIFQLWGDADLRLSRPAAPASAPLVHLHPRPIGGAPPFDLLTGFVGRREQLLALGRWFDATGKGVFAISGVGGVGKTTLALAAALRHLHRFAALAFASAKAQPDFGLRQVLEATAAALQVQPDERMYANPAAAIATLLNARPLLLLLDNLESLDADAIQDLARALRGADFRNGSRVLLTLRPHERSPLTDLAGGDRLALETLARQDACRLVREEADRLGLPDERLRHPDPATAGSLGMTRHDGQLAAGIDQIAALCFDHPGLLRLALRMLRRHDRAGLNLRLHTLQGKEVQAALTEFIGLMVADLEKQSPAAVQTLVAAAVFVGGAAEPLLAQVARGEPLAEAERIAWEDDWLLPAVDAGLLRQVSAGRYDLDAPVRGFLGKVRPLAAETERQLHLRHAQALLPVVAAWGDLIAAQEMTYAAPREWDNVTAAWDRLCEMGGADEAGETLLAFSEEWGNTVRNNYDPRRLHWLESAAQAAFRIGSEWQQANVLKAQGDVLAFQNQNDEALQHYEHAFRLFQQVGSSLGQANVLQAQGDVLAFLDRRDEALQHYEHAFRLFQQVG
ncbi:MAG: tetratricopeptide repeat protein, partial [Caldilineales bacterium]|nr:tetratricopeptide repeat protein [Caldilineales bacterium]